MFHYLDEHGFTGPCWEVTVLFVYIAAAPLLLELSVGRLCNMWLSYGGPEMVRRLSSSGLPGCYITASWDCEECVLFVQPNYEDLQHEGMQRKISTRSLLVHIDCESYMTCTAHQVNPLAELKVIRLACIQTALKVDL